MGPAKELTKKEFVAKVYELANLANDETYALDSDSHVICSQPGILENFHHSLWRSLKYQFPSYVTSGSQETVAKKLNALFSNSRIPLTYFVAPLSQIIKNVQKLECSKDAKEEILTTIFTQLGKDPKSPLEPLTEIPLPVFQNHIAYHLAWKDLVALESLSKSTRPAFLKEELFLASSSMRKAQQGEPLFVRQFYKRVEGLSSIATKEKYLASFFAQATKKAQEQFFCLLSASRNDEVSSSILQSLPKDLPALHLADCELLALVPCAHVKTFTITPSIDDILPLFQFIQERLISLVTLELAPPPERNINSFWSSSINSSHLDLLAARAGTLKRLCIHVSVENQTFDCIGKFEQLEELSLTINNNSMHINVSGLHSLKNLRILSITNLGTGTIGFLPNLPQLKTLTFSFPANHSQNNNKYIKVSLQNCPEIESLTLEGKFPENELQNLWNSICNLKLLKSLGIISCDLIAPKFFEYFIKTLSKNQKMLAHLKLHIFDGMAFSSQVFKAIGEFSELQSLEISSSASLGAKDQTLEPILLLPKLTSFSCSNAKQISGSCFEAIQNLERFESIDLSGWTSLTSTSINIIGKMSNLRMLKLDGIFTDAWATILPNLKKLESLSLSNSPGFSDCHIDIIRNLQNLKSLQMTYCRNISSKGTQELISLFPSIYKS